MGIPSITQIRSAIGNFAVANNWDIEIAGESPIGFINVRAKSVDIPKMSIKTLPVNIVGFKTKQPGPGEYTDNIIATFYESEIAEISEYIRNWRTLAWRRTGGGHQPSNTDLATGLKRSITLNRLSRDGEKSLYSYILYGCFPTDIDIGTLDDGDKILEAKVTFSYDYYMENQRTPFPDEGVKS